MPQPFAIHWFRRDLRIAGNPALQYGWKKFHGRVLGFFSFDSTFLARPDFSPNRFGFFLQTLQTLREEMRAQGGDLLVVDDLPAKALPKLVEWLRAHGQEHTLAELTHNRDYEPFARHRDETVAGKLKELGLPVHTERDHLVIEPTELEKDGPGSYYQVYTPFSKKWFSLKAAGEFRDRLDPKRNGIPYLKQLAAEKQDAQLFKLKWKDLGKLPYEDALADFIEKNKKRVTISLPAAGSLAAWNALKDFSQKTDDYSKDRDFPAVAGTSRLSLFFKNGSLTPAQAIAALGLAECSLQDKSSRTKFLQEIVWREFYYHILYHCPRVEKEAFLTKYNDLAWEENPAWLTRWQEGQTGFPIVDAGMRELLTTGWMHNRVRMIVASFLTKDLLINWQEGENYFMRTLLDGDLAPNNGGWQWAASTGCDPQPYFRVFNPWLQGAKFDPAGEYIKRYVPELAHCRPDSLHEEEADRGKYPRPMVIHRLQKDKAIRLYKK